MDPENVKPLMTYKYNFKSYLFIAFLIFTTIPVYMYFTGEEWTYLVIYPIIYLLVLINQLSTRYFLKENKLVVKDLTKKKEIDFTRITSVTKQENNWFSRIMIMRPKVMIVVRYDKFEKEELSPQNPEKFAEELNTLWQNSAIF